MSEQPSQSNPQSHSSSTAAVATPIDSGPGAREHEKAGCMALAIGLFVVGAISIAMTVLAFFLVRGF